jgi:hypothetical protein
LNFSTQSRTICSVTPPILAASVRPSSLIHHAQRQQALGLTSVLGFTDRRPQLRRIEVLPQRDRHREPPSFTTFSIAT